MPRNIEVKSSPRVCWSIRYLATRDAISGIPLFIFRKVSGLDELAESLDSIECARRPGTLNLYSAALNLENISLCIGNSGIQLKTD